MHELIVIQVYLQWAGKEVALPLSVSVCVWEDILFIFQNHLKQERSMVLQWCLIDVSGEEFKGLPRVFQGGFK